ncbi:MAG: GNAT family N-acetyltransferase [candidate division WOR-3 bacterium]
MAIVMRLARASDRSEVERICANTWHNWDYIPRYFPQWIREGGFYVATEGKRLVGMAKITELSPGELWLEGLRVDPERRSQGLGWKISGFILKQALKSKPISLRLATGRRNVHSRRIIRRMGFRLKVSLWGRDGRIPKCSGKPDTFVPDPDVAFEYIRRTEEYRESRHLLQHTWQFRTITPALLAELVEKRRVFAYGANHHVRGLLIVQPGRYESGRLDLSFIEGDRRALGEFRKQVWVFAQQHRAEHLSGIARGRCMLRHMGGLRMRPWRTRGHLPWVLVYEYPLARSC